MSYTELSMTYRNVATNFGRIQVSLFQITLPVSGVKSGVQDSGHQLSTFTIMLLSFKYLVPASSSPQNSHCSSRPDFCSSLNTFSAPLFLHPPAFLCDLGFTALAPTSAAHLRATCPLQPIREARFFISGGL